MTEETQNDFTEPEPEEAPPSPAAAEADAELEPPHPVRSGPRPERRALVPLWIYGLVAALVAVVAIGVGVAFAVNRSVTQPVPDVTGLDSDVARTRLRAAGFEFTTGDKRFSVEPLGTVLEQEPAGGELARRGSSIVVIVSAGTEEFQLPDIVGDGIALGRGVLEDRGLEVKVNAEASDQPRDTVLATNPAPGALVHTGDIVIVSVASTETVSGDIVPYRFGGTHFILDPGQSSGGADLQLDVARRLRSLLEASGAAVIVTRSLANSSTVQSRAAKVKDPAAAALVGIDVRPSGKGGFAVSTPSGLDAPREASTRRLAAALVSALTLQTKSPSTSSIAPDAIVRASTAPVARISLGSYGNRDDAASFRDPTWADQVARTIYRALGDAYGTR